MEKITGSRSNMVVVIGSVLALIGSFLAWGTVSAAGVSVSVSCVSRLVPSLPSRRRPRRCLRAPRSALAGRSSRWRPRQCLRALPWPR